MPTLSLLLVKDGKPLYLDYHSLGPSTHPGPRHTITWLATDPREPSTPLTHPALISGKAARRSNPFILQAGSGHNWKHALATAYHILRRRFRAAGYHCVSSRPTPPPRGGQPHVERHSTSLLREAERKEIE